ncbi:MAG: 30S ribosomal protein S21 [Sulfurovum sp.]|nr:30S ribosomal protein S21 [Sulfurovum sp.]
MPGIKLTSRDSFDDAYRKFKRQCDRNLIVTEARARHTLKHKLRRTKKRRLQLARKSLKNSSCLEDTSLDCKFCSSGASCPATQSTFQFKLQQFFLQLITIYLTFR